MGKHINFRRFKLSAVEKNEKEENGKTLVKYTMGIPTPFKSNHWDRYYDFLYELTTRAGLTVTREDVEDDYATVQMNFSLEKTYNEDGELVDVKDTKLTVEFFNEDTGVTEEDEIALFVDEYNGLDKLIVAYERKYGSYNDNGNEDEDDLPFPEAETNDTTEDTVKAEDKPIDTEKKPENEDIKVIATPFGLLVLSRFTDVK